MAVVPERSAFSEAATYLNRPPLHLMSFTAAADRESRTIRRRHSGEGGIRTHGTVSRSGAFKAPALVHYATSPGAVFYAREPASIQILAHTHLGL